MENKFIRIMDWYIIKKYLGTFFLAITLIISISIIFDISENIDDFITKKAPLRAIVVDYYFNFIPYFANLFSSLFTFIAVIFFTSKMASNSEIIAIQASGVSYNRLMRPYMIAAFAIAVMSWLLGNFVIPPATEARVNFRNRYIKSEFINKDKNIHRQLEPGLFIYMWEYKTRDDVGLQFSMERFKERRLVSKLMADNITWDREKKKWTIHNYYIRDYTGPKEVVTAGAAIDTTLKMNPSDFGQQSDRQETMDYMQLNSFIANLKLRGVDNIARYEKEKYQRTAGPISTFILTIMGVSLASRKVRGGMGLNLGLGLMLSFTYIMFMQVSTIFAYKAAFNTLLAVWLPNMVYALIAVVLYRRAAKL